MADSVLSAFVTNLGKYNEGELVGEYLKFPTTTEEVQALLKRIGVDGVLYEEIFITDYETDVSGLYDCLGEYESIDEFNHLACLLEDLDGGELRTFEAALEQGEHTSSLQDVINLAENLDCYEFYPDISDQESLGRYYVDEVGALEVPEHLQYYFDYEAYGRDVALEEGGDFVNGGYVVQTSSLTEAYSGREDIPDEHKVFSMPKLSIREQMAAYKEVVEREPKAAVRALSEHDLDNR